MTWSRWEGFLEEGSEGEEGVFWVRRLDQTR